MTPLERHKATTVEQHPEAARTPKGSHLLRTLSSQLRKEANAEKLALADIFETAADTMEAGRSPVLVWRVLTLAKLMASGGDDDNA